MRTTILVITVLMQLQIVGRLGGKLVSKFGSFFSSKTTKVIPLTDNLFLGAAKEADKKSKLLSELINDYSEQQSKSSYQSTSQADNLAIDIELHFGPEDVFDLSADIIQQAIEEISEYDQEIDSLKSYLSKIRYTNDRYLTPRVTVKIESLKSKRNEIFNSIINGKNPFRTFDLSHYMVGVTRSNTYPQLQRLEMREEMARRKQINRFTNDPDLLRAKKIPVFYTTPESKLQEN